MKTRLTLALAAAVLLAACDRSPAPQSGAEPYNDAVTEAAPAAPMPEPEPLPAPEPEPAAPANMALDVPPPADPVLPDEQMLEDAEATGMTARVARGEEGDAARNDSAVVEEK